jgi:coproporphyrinogen III oxidase
MTAKDSFTNYIHKLQDTICAALEQADGKGKFVEDAWERPGGGGGKTRILRDGAVIEKGGVNTSVVFGELPELMQERLNANSGHFFACGISLVIHPINPMVPTVHANFRYFELYNADGHIQDAWFGGGADLTPYYLFDEDAQHFHNALKEACDPFGVSFYPEYKKACDAYFFNSHRGESRGIGGIFFDYLKASEEHPLSFWQAFTQAVGDSFVAAYIPIVEKRKKLPYNEQHVFWQGIRRGRYVEFNLIHDRGTLFGLKTNGRIESILMSLPATARWEYDHQPKPNTAEFRLLEILKSPIDWIP